MPVDNQLYDRLAETWWNENSFAQPATHSMNPARFGYMRRILTEGAAASTPRAARPSLDVGCGGGLLAEEFAASIPGLPAWTRLTGVRRDRPRTRRARRASRSSTMEGAASRLPPRLPFEHRLLLRVLEHVDDFGRDLDETARVLEARRPPPVRHDQPHAPKQAGVVINHQEWRSTALTGGPNLHDWDMFIKPSEWWPRSTGGPREPRPRRHRAAT